MPARQVTVYSLPACVQCTATYRALDKLEIDYVVVDLADDANAGAREWIGEELGYSRAPVVVVDDDLHWAGYRPDRIAALRAAVA